MYELAAFCMNGQFKLGQVPPWRYFLAVGVAVGLVLGFTAPAPDEDLSWSLMLQWQVQSLTAIALLVISQILLGRTATFRTLNPWIQLLISGGIASLLIAPIYLLVDIMNGLNSLPSGISEWAIALLDELSGFLPPVLVTWLAVNAPFCLGYRFVTDEPDLQPAAQASPAGLNFTDLQPDEIFYIKAELHYIKVATESDSELVLHNLKDAADEIPLSLGVICHRSYWVSYAAIEKFEKKGRQGSLLLRNGESIPVSRQHVAKFV
jgi:hypothetical protein